eukprot:UN24914
MLLMGIKKLITPFSATKTFSSIFIFQTIFFHHSAIIKNGQEKQKKKMIFVHQKQTIISHESF